MDKEKDIDWNFFLSDIKSSENVCYLLLPQEKKCHILSFKKTEISYSHMPRAYSTEKSGILDSKIEYTSLPTILYLVTIVSSDKSVLRSFYSGESNLDLMISRPAHFIIEKEEQKYNFRCSVETIPNNLLNEYRHGYLQLFRRRTDEILITIFLNDKIKISEKIIEIKPKKITRFHIMDLDNE